MLRLFIVTHSLPFRVHFTVNNCFHLLSRHTWGTQGSILTSLNRWSSSWASTQPSFTISNTESRLHPDVSRSSQRALLYRVPPLFSHLLLSSPYPSHLQPASAAQITFTFFSTNMKAPFFFNLGWKLRIVYNISTSHLNPSDSFPMRFPSCGYAFMPGTVPNTLEH